MVLRRIGSAALFLGVLTTSASYSGDLGADLKKAVKEKQKGTYYLKTNVPYLQGRHAYGTFKRPLVMVTPTGGPKAEQSAEVQGSVFHAEGRNLSLRVNDPVKLEDFGWDGEEKTLEIELQGSGKASEGEGVLKFSAMESMPDFQKCWDATFSDVPIEQKYDWPDNIKQAVSERRVLEGMTREQVTVAVGNPESVTRSSESGKPVEVWLIQLGQGTKMGYWSMKVGDRKDMEIRFVDGKVTQIGGGTSVPPEVKLK